MVKKYDIEHDGEYALYDYNDDGKHLSYGDYEKLEKENAALRVELELYRDVAERYKREQC